jgi:sec-independent protein translocase protein TatB
MFDIGFFELMMIAVVALVLFGPEEMLRLAQAAGRFIRTLRQHKSRFMNEVKHLEHLSRHDK